MLMVSAWWKINNVNMVLLASTKAIGGLIDLNKKGSAVAWWLMPRTPDPEVGGSSPTRVKQCCVSLSKAHLLPKNYW